MIEGLRSWPLYACEHCKKTGTRPGVCCIESYDPKSGITRRRSLAPIEVVRFYDIIQMLRLAGHDEAADRLEDELMKGPSYA